MVCEGSPGPSTARVLGRAGPCPAVSASGHEQGAWPHPLAFFYDFKTRHDFYFSRGTERCFINITSHSVMCGQLHINRSQLARAFPKHAKPIFTVNTRAFSLSAPDVVPSLPSLQPSSLGCLWLSPKDTSPHSPVFRDRICDRGPPCSKTLWQSVLLPDPARKSRVRGCWLLPALWVALHKGGAEPSLRSSGARPLEFPPALSRVQDMPSALS